MENRKIPILHKPMAFGQQVPRKGLKAFCLFRLNRNKQKLPSLRSRRLCGENFLLDKLGVADDRRGE